MMRFCEKVKIIMKQYEIGQNELARKANLSSSGISAALSETGNPRESTMMAIYDALGMSPAQFWNDGRYSAEMSKEEKDLLGIFSQLNDAGKAALIASAEGMLSQISLRKKDSTKSAI